MMNSLLLSKIRTEPLQDRAHNSINGSDSESYAMAKLILACRGEGQWGSREEDNSKIDLIFSCEHPWYNRERMLVLSQVKSGASFGSSLEKGFKLTAKAKATAKRTSHGICLVWVDRDKNKIFWAYVHPDITVRTQEYGAHHEVSPTTLYDLARCISIKRSGTTGGTGIIIRKRKSDVTIRRRRIKTIYRGFGVLRSPILGEIELTRIGWRHMFRSSRRKENKSTSLDIIPYLRKILEHHPSTHAITSTKYFSNKGYQYRICEHLLKFDKIAVSEKNQPNSNNVICYIRVIEEIRYPVDWESNVMLSQLVSRRVVLKSAYYKNKNKM